MWTGCLQSLSYLCDLGPVVTPSPPLLNICVLGDKCGVEYSVDVTACCLAASRPGGPRDVARRFRVPGVGTSLRAET
jgi:hypothetical protein